MSNPKWPYGPASAIVVTPAAGVGAATITNNMTFLSFAAALAADTTLNLTIDAELEAGAKLVVKALCDGTERDVIPGTGMDGPTIVLVVSKTKVATYTFDGTNFVMDALAVQID
jgi:hypothetical protein